MLTQQDKPDILERLRHPEREQERRKMSRNLFIRNILNVVFTLIALVVIVGICVDRGHVQLWCTVGLIAVVIKMVEVMMRMPGIKK